MIDVIITVASGLSLEATAVFWTHCSERGYAVGGAFFSALQAIGLLFGIGESVHDMRLAPWFVLSYATGSFLAIKIKGSPCARRIVAAAFERVGK